MSVASKLRAEFREIVASVPADVSITLFHPPRGVLVSIEGDRPMPSASVIKLCVMVSALRRVVEGGWSLRAAPPGRAACLMRLVWDMITKSCNESTNELIEALGMERIDREIHGLMGLSQGTCLKRVMLDWEARERGVDNLITTDDVARLLQGIHSSAHLPKELTETVLGMLSSQEDRSRIPAGIPADSGAVVGNKTGGLPLVHNDAALIEEKNRNWWTLVVAIHGLESEEDANTLIRTISETAWAGLHERKPKRGAK